MQHPDFSDYSFEIIRKQGHNLGGSCVTYLAKTGPDLSPSMLVVLKQCQFAKGGNGAGFKAIEQETQILKDLKHPGIPRYLGSFETDDGFCLVQEYKKAEPLSVLRSFSPDDIKHIATQLLEILVYLQDRTPQVFHRDIKPENVLVSDDLQVYLIDFGFARIGGENLAMSSVERGTFGFMAPEQTQNLQLTPASDLYGLGLTLVCVIAQLKSPEIGKYVDWNNQLGQKAIEAKLKSYSLPFIEWLNQMIAPDPKKRFPDAKTALEVLKTLYVKRTPKVKLSCTFLKFEATQVGEKLSQTLTLTNSIPETTLEGTWEVAPHPNDPPHTPDSHPWISFYPKTVQGNQVTCKVTVDTNQLQTEQQGSRQLIFQSNADLNKVFVSLEVKTASPLGSQPRGLFLREVLYSSVTAINGILLVSGLVLAFQVGEGWLAVCGAVVGAIFGAVVMAGTEAVAVTGAVAVAVAGAVFGTVFEAVFKAGAVAVAMAGDGAIFGAVAGAGVWLVTGVVAGIYLIATLDTDYRQLPRSDRCAAWVCFWVRFFLALVCGGGLGMGMLLGFTAHILIPLVSLGTGAGLVYVSMLPMLTRRRQLAAQRRKEHSLIEP
ncbi:MAG: serine/threonine protein kinase [Prochlorotrichaceae cyanobacterium]